MQRPEPLEYKVIAGPEDFQPSSDRMKIVGAFNPGVTTVRGEDGTKKTLLIARVCEMPVEVSDEYVLLPHFPITNCCDSPFRVELDSVNRDSIREEGRKEVKLNTRLSRLKHISYPIIATSSNGIDIDCIEETPSFHPCYEHERFGMEDFRITKMRHPYDGPFWLMTYVSPHRRHMVSTSVAMTRDFKTFERLPYGDTPKPIFRGEKDVALFPKQVPLPEQRNQGHLDSLGNRRLVNAALRRHSSYPDHSNPSISVSHSAPGSFQHWDSGHRIIVSGDDEMSGTGAVVWELKDMWFGVYHIVRTEKDGDKEIKKYYGALFGLKKDDPTKLLYRSSVLINPNEHDKGEGFVPNVVYPQGLIISKGFAYIYSGENDTWVSVRKYNLEDLVRFLVDQNINGH
jgi:predicted GH43/DUF377 family glycosyl hydrolase